MRRWGAAIDQARGSCAETDVVGVSPLEGEDALDRYRFVRAAQAVGFRLGEI